MTLEYVLALLRKKCAEAGDAAAWARANGISPSYVNDALHGRRLPGGKLLMALGVERVMTYRMVRERRLARRDALDGDA